METGCPGAVVRPVEEYQEAVPGTGADPGIADLRGGPEHPELSGARAAARPDSRARPGRPGGRSTPARIRAMGQGPRPPNALVTLPCPCPCPGAPQVARP